MRCRKRNKNGLELLCGDPRNKPATFSRFVLPFAYKAERTNDAELHYKEVKEDEWLLARKKYFTAETRMVLFEQAKWLEMNETPPALRGNPETGKDEGFVFKHHGKEIKVNMLPPRLVLFDWESEDSRSQDKPGIFQTAFLCVDLWFPETDGGNKPAFDDLLRLNEMFRYFDWPNYEGHKMDYLETLGDAPVEYNTSNPETVSDRSKKLYECYFARWANLLIIPVKINDEFYRLVPENILELGVSYFEDTEKLTDAPRASDFLVYADNRAYVWSAAIFKEGAEALKDFFKTGEWRAREYGHWIKFLNVDKPDSRGMPSKTHSGVMEFEKKWADERTYHRWEEWGTWYGFSYHSGVMMGPPKTDVPLWCHFRLMYFDIVLLLFYLRVTLFRFSRQLSEIACESCDWRLPFEALRKNFSRFSILYQFPLLSNQEQAIEMYTLARKHFDIDDFYEEVKREIDDTHDYFETIRARELSEAANRMSDISNKIAMIGIIISYLAIPLTVAGLMASLFGMDLENLHLWENLSHWPGFRPNMEFWSLTGVVALSGIVSVFLCWFFIRIKFPFFSRKGGKKDG